METWRQVVGWSGYEVSDLGRVMSYRTSTPKLLTPCDRGRGYIGVKLVSDLKSKTVQVHHLVMEAFIGPRIAGRQVNHKNGIKTDNRLENLEYCSGSENVRHARDTGLSRFRRGEECSHSKLTESEVIEIRIARSSGESVYEIASRFGVSPGVVTGISVGVIWKHVGGPRSVGKRPSGLVNQIKELRDQGLTLAAISKQVGRSTTTIGLILRESLQPS